MLTGSPKTGLSCLHKSHQAHMSHQSSSTAKKQKDAIAQRHQFGLNSLISHYSYRFRTLNVTLVAELLNHNGIDILSSLKGYNDDKCVH